MAAVGAPQTLKERGRFESYVGCGLLAQHGWTFGPFGSLLGPFLSALLGWDSPVVYHTSGTKWEP